MARTASKRVTETARTSKKKVATKVKESKEMVATFGKGISVPDIIPGFDVEKTLDAIEKKVGVGSTGLGSQNDARTSTGLLMVDLVLGGGITAGWYTCFGEEQCCKSTLVNTIMANAITQNVPIIGMYDYEGSTEPNYMQNILYTLRIKAEVSDVFGIRDRNGNYVKKARVRYNPFDTAEQFFDYLAMLERELPDKIYQGGKWWYVYANTVPNRKKLASSGFEYDKELFRRNNKFYVPAKDGSLQAILIPDSYPAMLPENLDVDDPNSGLAAVARMFAAQLPRVKGKLRRKRIAVIGVNQLRDVPMARYGPPKKQAAGNAVRFFCFSGDTFIYTDKGMLSASEIVNRDVDYKVLSPSGLEKPNLFSYVKTDSPTVINTKFGRSLTASPTHRVWCAQKDPGGLKLSTVQWKQVKDINPAGTYVAIQYGQNVWSKKDTKLDFVYTPNFGPNEVTEVSLPKTMSPSLARFLGYFVAEGYMRGKLVQICNKDEKLLDDVQHLYKKLFGLTTARTGGSVKAISVVSTKLGAFLRWLGMDRPSYEKEIPLQVRTSTRETVVNFLRGYCEGESSVGAREMNVSSSSEKLMTQAHLLMLNLGIPATINQTAKRNWNTGRYYYSIYLSGQGYDIYNSTIGHLADRKRAIAFAKKSRTDIAYCFEDLSEVWPLRALLRVTTGLLSEKCWTARQFLDGVNEMTERIAKGVQKSGRENLTKLLEQTKAFCEFTENNKVIWSKVNNVVRGLPSQPLYDFNMPSNQVITNGIISHNSDVRLQNTSRALSYEPEAKPGKDPKGQPSSFEWEDSVEFPGKDCYRYIEVKGEKNKFSQPYLKAPVRLWIEDGQSNARGFDPVYDTYTYLKSTGQLTGNRKSMMIKIEGEQTKKPLTWPLFKLMVLGERDAIKDVCVRVGLRPMMIRNLCFKQMKTGTGIDMYFANQQAKAVARAAKTQDTETEDDEEQEEE